MRRSPIEEEDIDGTLSLARWLKRQTQRMFQYAEARIKGWTQPPSSQLITGAVADMAQSKTELIAENALLRQRLIVLQRQTTPPR